MEITKPPTATQAAAPAPGTSGLDKANIGSIPEPAAANEAAPKAALRGPKVLQSHQARQRCLEFSRG